MTCPGDLLSGLVDGELDHPTRERVLSHLLACAPCRAEVESLRALRARLSWAGAETPLPHPDLTARLHAMAVPGVEPVQSQRPPVTSSRPVSLRPAARGSGSLRPRRTRIRPRTVGSIVALGLAAAFALGGQAQSERRVPVDPASDQFVADYVDSTVEVPVVRPIDASVVGISR